jgi:hypothetical protein
MSDASVEAGSQAIALIVHSLASKAIHGSSENIAEGVAVGLSAAAPVVMLLAGMMSKGFSDSSGNAHPTGFATDDSILFAALLVSRSIIPGPNGCGMQMSPEGFADTVADFAKLKPLTAIETVIRSDVLSAASRGSNDGAALLSGLMSKRLAN